jgi:hypothetical protein
MTSNLQTTFSEYTPPQYDLDGFHCPHSRCGVFSKQTWFHSAVLFYPNNWQGPFDKDNHYQFAKCDRCGDISIWHDGKLIYPVLSIAPAPHKKTPQEILQDYEEARNILPSSPRGSAALLRLATEKLAIILVEKTGKGIGKDLNDNIRILVGEGLPVAIQKALDTLRVIGNEAVHPGMLDLKDDQETALRLFRLVNVIVDNRIAQVEEIESIYADKVPEVKKQQIVARDKTA